MRYVLALVFLSLSGASPLSAQELTVVNVDVGQGDATLIIGPVNALGDRIAVLVDAGDIPFGGDRDGGGLVARVLEENRIGHLDYFVLTHYDSDHLGGVVTGNLPTHGTSFLLGPDRAPGSPGDDDGDNVADWLGGGMTDPDPEELGTGDDIPVAVFIDRGDVGAPRSRAYDKYVAMATAMGDRLSLDSQDAVDSFEIDLGGGARMVALAANGYVRAREQRVAYVNTENERSLCFLVEYGGFQYLIGGDMTGRRSGNENAEVERAVGEYLSNARVNVDVLHVNHHGADNASESTFLELVQPEVAIISVGNGNPYHHPDLDALTRLAAAGISLIYQTECGSVDGILPEIVQRALAIAQGDIVIHTDGQSYEITTARRLVVDEPIQ